MALDTDDCPQSSPTSPSEKSGSGGAGVDLDRLVWATLNGDAQEFIAACSPAVVLALIGIAEAARSVHAGLTCAQDPMDVDERIERLGAALAAAGGGPDER